MAFKITNFHEDVQILRRRARHGGKIGRSFKLCEKISFKMSRKKFQTQMRS